MYQIIKIIGARTNVPEPITVPLKKSATVGRGIPVRIKNGELTVFSNTDTALPTHLTLAPVNGMSALCCELTPAMILETTVSASPASMAIGGEYLVSGDGSSVSATAISGSLRGATVIYTGEAKATGDKILVAFR